MKNLKHLHIFTGLLLFFFFAIGIVQAQDPSPEEIIEAIKVFTDSEIIQQLESPDGTFTAEVTRYDCVEISGQETAYEYMILIDNRTGEPQQIADQLINCGGLGAFGLWALHWSEQSSYLYYTDEREGMPDGLVQGWTPSISRIQTADMQVDLLGAAQFSPHLQWLAVWDLQTIEIISMATDEIRSFEQTPAELYLTELIWLPDSSGVIYIQVEAPYGVVTRNTVTHLDLMTGSQTVLLDREG